MLDDRLPQRHDAQIRLVAGVADGIFHRCRQTVIATDVPKEDVSIEQQSHPPSNRLKISSGSGASKPSGTTNSPSHKPKGRGCSTPRSLISEMGLISARGLSACVTTSVSPACTRRR